MAAVSYAYTGGVVMYYQDYLDVATGKMLVAEPGGSYVMVATDPARPVPPTDGRWAGAPPVPPPPPFVAATQLAQPVTAPAPAPAPAPQGGESA